MNNEKVTIKTIAKMAHVSHTTVSRALNDSPLVKQVTKDKIKRLADQMNYIPNLNAKALVEKKTFVIAIYFTDINNGTSPDFMAEVIHQAKDILPKGYEIAVDSFSDLRLNKQNINSSIDGALVVSQSEVDDYYIDQLAKIKKPLVVLNRKIKRSDLYNFVSDPYKSTELAINYLIRCGHKKVAYISGRPDFTSTQLSTKAFHDVMSKNQLPINDQWMVDGDYSIASGYKAMEQILNTGEIPSCVFAGNDDMAMGAIRACKDYGYTVPGDISFMGFDDNTYSKYFSPRLTTIRKPTAQLTRAGITTLNSLINNEKPTSEQFVDIQPTLVARDSVKSLAKSLSLQ